eukprot:gene33620-43450_t
MESMNVAQATAYLGTKDAEKNTINEEIQKLEELLLLGVIGKFKITALDINPRPVAQIDETGSETISFDFESSGDSFLTRLVSQTLIQETAEIELTKDIESIKVKCISTSTRTSTTTDVSNDAPLPAAEEEEEVVWKSGDPAPIVAAPVADVDAVKGDEQLEKEEAIAMGKEETLEIASPSSSDSVVEKGTSDTAAVSEESETFSAVEERPVVPVAEPAEEEKKVTVPTVSTTTTTTTTTLTLTYEGEIALSDLPADGSELRSTLTLRLVAAEPSEDSMKGQRDNLSMGFKAAYETLESLISSKRLELEQLEQEIASIGQRISELRHAAEKKPQTPASAKEPSSTANSNSKKSVKGRGSKKAPSTKRPSSSRTAASTEGGPEAADGDSTRKGWPSMQSIVTNVSTWATNFAALAVEHRAVGLFAISAVGIYLAGDSASV